MPSIDVFLSHSSGDAAVARELRAALEAAGYSCWMAPDDVVGNDPWAEQILAAIEATGAMVVLISANANGSPHVSREVNLALSRKRPVIPVRIENVAPQASLEYLLALMQRVDVFPPPVADHAPRLVRRLEAVLGQGERPSTGPTVSPEAVIAPLAAPRSSPRAIDEPAPAVHAPAVSEPAVPAPVVRDSSPPARRPGTGLWARANSMAAGSLVTVAALVLVTAGVLAFGNPAASGAPSPGGAGHASPGSSTVATSPSTGPTALPSLTPPPTLPPPSGPFLVIGEGTFEVGVDVQPGTYRVHQRHAGCFWERRKGRSDQQEDVLANEFANDGYAIVTIKSSDLLFATNACDEWTTDLSAVTDSMTVIDEPGTYIVGTDISPGTWRSSGGAGCYWARLSGFTGGIDDIIENEFRDEDTGPFTVRIEAGDTGFHTNECGDWERR